MTSKASTIAMILLMTGLLHAVPAGPAPCEREAASGRSATFSSGQAKANLA